MSFAYEAKQEVLSCLCENECCKLAQLSAIIHSCGELGIKNGQMYIQVRTDLKELFNIIYDTINRLYGVKLELRVDPNKSINKATKYLIDFPVEISRQVMFDCGLAKLDVDGDFELIRGIDEHIVESPCCAISYIKGIFLTSATTNIIIDDSLDKVSRTFSGYHLEFVFSSEVFANDFSNLLSQQGISSKVTMRKKIYALYIKEAEQVSDLLVIVGAVKSMLKLQNEISLRQVRNNVNRQNNCINANITKTVNASLNQISAIEKLKEVNKFDALDDQMKEICNLRVEHPEDSLDSLTRLASFPITKSGINHKFRKVIKLAEKFGASKGEEATINNTDIEE